jgi:hypothetical protein
MQLDALIAACGGCRPKPSAYHSVIVDEIAPTLAAPGMSYQCNFNGVPMKDSAGRIAHVRGISIETSAVLALDATAGAVAPATSHYLRRLLTNIKLQGRGNHLYTESIDARDIVDDSWGRNLRIQNSRPLAPDLNTGAVLVTADGLIGYPVPDQTLEGFGSPLLGAATRTDTVDISTDLWFTTPGENPMHGLIPLFELVTAVNGSLRFTFGSGDIDGGIPANGTRTPTGYTVPETLGSVAARVWLHLVYVDALIVDPRWKIDSYTVDRLKGSLKYLDATTRHAMVRNHEEEALLTAVDGLATNALNVEVDGFNEIEGLSADRMRSRLMMILAQDDMSEHMDFNRSVALPAFTPTVAANDFGPLNRTRNVDFLVPYRSRRSLSPSGPVNYTFSNFSGVSQFQRVLHRIVECQDMARVKADAQKAYGAASGRCACVPVDDTGAPTGNMSATTTVVVKPQ